MNFRPPKPYLTSRAQQGRPGRWTPTAADNTLVYEPTDRQKVFHACNAEVILYGGAAGGAKSHALLMEAYLFLRETPGAYGVLMRRSFPELERSLILRSRSLFPKGHCRYNELQHRWTIRPSNGGKDSILDFSYCRNVKEAEDLYKSAEFTFLGIDELTLNEWDTIVFLMSRSRSAIPGVKPRIVFASNPGGQSHVEVKKYFGIGRPGEVGYVIPETIFTPEPSDDDEMPLSRCFIPAKLSDNPHLAVNDPTYIKKLSLLPPNTRKMLRDGDWDVFEGKFFSEFTDKNIVTPFQIPKYWKIYRTVDYGYTAPFCCLWLAASPDGHYYIFRELYVRNLTDIQQAKLIKESSPEIVEYTTCDPTMRNRNASGISPLENYATNDIHAIPGDNNRVMGWMAMRNMYALHGDGKPITQVFNTCSNYIREIKSAVYDDREVDDIFTRSKHDHAIDAHRYFCSSRPVLPEPPKRDPYQHLDEASRREWESIDKKTQSLTNNLDGAILRELNEEDY